IPVNDGGLESFQIDKSRKELESERNLQDDRRFARSDHPLERVGQVFGDEEGMSIIEEPGIEDPHNARMIACLKELHFREKARLAVGLRLPPEDLGCERDAAMRTRGRHDEESRGVPTRTERLQVSVPYPCLGDDTLPYIQIKGIGHANASSRRVAPSR